MRTRKIAAVALICGLPGLAYAEDMWKWRDAKGRLHYSNVQETAAPQATKVARDIGVIGGDILGPAVKLDPPAEQAASTEPAASPAPTQRQRIRAEQLAAAARYSDVAPFWPGWATCASPWLGGPPLCSATQGDDPVAAQLWLQNAQTQMSLRRWGLGS